MELDRVNFTTFEITTKSGVRGLTVSQDLVYTYGAMQKKQRRIPRGEFVFLGIEAAFGPQEMLNFQDLRRGQMR